MSEIVVTVTTHDGRSVHALDFAVYCEKCGRGYKNYRITGRCKGCALDRKSLKALDRDKEFKSLIESIKELPGYAGVLADWLDDRGHDILAGHVRNIQKMKVSIVMNQGISFAEFRP